MNALIGFLVIAVVTAISLIIVSKLPLGVEVDSFGKAVIAGVIFGVLNAFVRPILTILGFPLVLLTLGLFLLVINAIVFALSAWLVDGFRLRWGFWSALLGSICLSLVNSVLTGILARTGLLPGIS